MSNAPYTELGLWPSGGTPPSFDGMTWKPAVTDSRLGFWQGTLTTPSVSLGGMTVVRDSFSNQPTFGAPNNLCAKARIYLFDDDAFLRFTSAAPADHQHLPWIADPYTTLEYKAYYLGNQETSPNSQCDRPEDEPGGSAFAAVKPEVRTLLEGLRPGESRTKEIACNANFALALACSSWDTTRLYATAVMDQVLPAT